MTLTNDTIAQVVALVLRRMVGEDGQASPAVAEMDAMNKKTLDRLTKLNESVEALAEVLEDMLDEIEILGAAADAWAQDPRKDMERFLELYVQERESEAAEELDNIKPEDFDEDAPTREVDDASE